MLIVHVERGVFNIAYLFHLDSLVLSRYVIELMKIKIFNTQMVLLLLMRCACYITFKNAMRYLIQNGNKKFYRLIW